MVWYYDVIIMQVPITWIIISRRHAYMAIYLNLNDYMQPGWIFVVPIFQKELLQLIILPKCLSRLDLLILNDILHSAVLFMSSAPCKHR